MKRIIKEKSNQISFQSTGIFNPSPICPSSPMLAATPSGSPGCSQCPLPARSRVFSPLMRSPSHRPGRRRPESQWYSSSLMGLWCVGHSHRRTGRRKRLEPGQTFQPDIDPNWTVLTTMRRRHVSLTLLEKQVMQPL